jgi:hypothetical protein
MSVTQVSRGPIDPSRVDIRAAQDLKYWCRALGVSVERLVHAVEEVGNMADDVRAELKRQRRTGREENFILARLGLLEFCQGELAPYGHSPNTSSHWWATATSALTVVGGPGNGPTGSALAPRRLASLPDFTGTVFSSDSTTRSGADLKVFLPLCCAARADAVHGAAGGSEAHSAAGDVRGEVTTGRVCRATPLFGHLPKKSGRSRAAAEFRQRGPYARERLMAKRVRAG